MISEVINKKIIIFLVFVFIFMFSIPIQTSAVSAPCCENGTRTLTDSYACAMCTKCSAGSCPTSTTPKATSTNAPTATTRPTATPTPKPTATPTPKPTATSTSAPTATTRPTSTASSGKTGICCCNALTNPTSCSWSTNGSCGNQYEYGQVPESSCAGLARTPAPTATQNSCNIANCATYASPRTANNCYCSSCGQGYISPDNGKSCVLASCSQPCCVYGVTVRDSTTCSSSMPANARVCGECSSGQGAVSTSNMATKPAATSTSAPTTTKPTAASTNSPTTTKPTATSTGAPTASTCSISHCKTYSSQTATNCKCSKCDSGYSSTDSGVSCKSCEDQCANTGSGYSYCMTQCTGTTVTATPSTSPTAASTNSPTTTPIPVVLGGILNSNLATVKIFKNASYTFLFAAIPLTSNGTIDSVTFANWHPKWSYSGDPGASGKTIENSTTRGYELEVKGIDPGDKTCKKHDYTVTVKDGFISKSKTVSTCVYCRETWYCKSIDKTFKNQKINAPEKADCYYYDGEKQVTGGYHYNKVCNRCCGDPPDEPSDVGACYGNAEYLGLATTAKWYGYNETPPKGYHKYSEITNEDDCKLTKVDLCSKKDTSSTTTSKTNYTNYCEDSKNISISQNRICGEFYKIYCTKTIETKFDYGDDNSNKSVASLLKGQGFGFGVYLKTYSTCNASVDTQKWKSTYNELIEKVKKIDNSLVTYVENNNADGWVNAVDKLKVNQTTKSQLYELWRDIVIGLRNIIAEDYMNFKPSEDTTNESVTLKMTYDVVKGNPITVNDAFDKVETQEGKFVKKESSSKTNLPMKLNNIPKSYTITNQAEKNKRIIKYAPKRAYLDRYYNMDDTTKKTIDGGNKIYLDYNVKPTTGSKEYSMTVTVSGIDQNQTQIIDNKCSITVGETELTYRPISLENPFISGARQKGQNWSNDLYDFTGEIKPSIWSGNAQYVIGLKSSEVVDLKKSTTNFIKNTRYSPYLGLCDGVQSTLLDSITNKICGILK